MLLVLLAPSCAGLLSSQRTKAVDMSSLPTSQTLVRIAESSWRTSAARHQQRILELLQPGLTDLSHPMNVGLKRSRRRNKATNGISPDGRQHVWTSLDPKNPIYNFLIEYYGLKGSKGTRRLARWSPCPSLLLSSQDGAEENTIADAILLEGADERDLGDLLHLRGAMPHNDGILYSPCHFFGKGNVGPSSEGKKKTAVPFLWYHSVLQQTLRAEPVLHCHGLHEWAMQYQPDGAPPPPSAKYQSHLPLRVDRQVINQVVERKGVHCTHVDALKYFAPAAGPLNAHGATLQRSDQLRLEQPACVHAQMDLIKISLKLQPFIDTDLLSRAVEIGLRARRLDVSASPYDGTAYGLSVIPIETPEGRAQYREEQVKIMHDANKVRRDLLKAYNVFLRIAFDIEDLSSLEPELLLNRDQREQSHAPQ